MPSIAEDKIYQTFEGLIKMTFVWREIVTQIVCKDDGAMVGGGSARERMSVSIRRAGGRQHLRVHIHQQRESRPACFLLFVFTRCT